MPNIKNQAKRVITNAKKQEANRNQKSALKSALKAVMTAVANNDKENAVAAYSVANKLLDKSVTSHLHHKNYAARQKSRLAKAVNNLK